MTYDQWTRKYKPIKNPLVEAPYDGKMFETFGPEFEFVKVTDPAKIWTLVDADGKLYVVDGFHICNRVGYFVTEVAYAGDAIEIRAR